MEEFKVGDVIIGNEENHYGITNNKTRSIIVHISLDQKYIGVYHIKDKFLFYVEARFFKKTNLGDDCWEKGFEPFNAADTNVGTSPEIEELLKICDFHSIDGSFKNVHFLKLDPLELEEEKEMVEYKMDKSIKYPWSEDEIDRMTTEAESIINEYELDEDTPYPVNYKYIKQYVVKNNERKGWFESVLSKHPNYIRDIHGVKFVREFTRLTDNDKIYSFCRELKDKIIPSVFKDKYEVVLPFTDEAYNSICNCRDRYIKIVDLLNGLVRMGIDKKDILCKRHNYYYYANKMTELNNRVLELIKLRENLRSILYYNSCFYVNINIYNEYRNLLNFVNDLCSNYTDRITEKQANAINNVYGFYEFARAVAGQKTTKVAKKIFDHYGLNEYKSTKKKIWYEGDERKEKDINDGWEHWFQIFCDSINPLKKKFTVIITTNPCDFLTMSKGSTWSSCMHIDKTNIDDTDENNYTGMYSGGTIDYGMDESTVIMYLLPEDYERDRPWDEGKIKRCLFYVGEDDYVQSRVYPDGRDGTDFPNIALEMNNIFRDVISTAMEIENNWTYKEKNKDVEIRDFIEANKNQLYYADFFQYGEEIHYAKAEELVVNRHNHKKIIVGSGDAICLSCGCINHNTNAIVCSSCENKYNTDSACPYCGREFNSENEGIWVEEANSWYCCEECAEDDGYRYCQDIEEWSSNYYLDEWNDDFYSLEDCERIETSDGCNFHGRYNAERGGYIEASDGEWYRENEVYYCEYCGEYVHESNWNEEYSCCVDCVEEVKENNAA